MKGVRPVVMDAFAFTENDIKEKVGAASKIWACELHKYADEIKKMLFKKKKNLAMAQEDVTERTATLEKRKRRAAEMEDVALDPSTSKRLQAEENELRDVEASTKGMGEKLALLEARYAAIPALAWPVFEQLSIADRLNASSPDELDIKTLIPELEELEGLGGSDED
jgi:hypothetical protein